jgi:hypothetical protein
VGAVPTQHLEELRRQRSLNVRLVVLISGSSRLALGAFLFSFLVLSSMNSPLAFLSVAAGMLILRRHDFTTGMTDDASRL